MNWTWIIQLIAGALGGNAAGAAKQFSLGPVGNSLIGLLGGVGGGHLLSALVPALGGAASAVNGAGNSGGLDLAGIIGQFAGGGIGGAILTLLVGFLKQKFMGQSPRA